MQFIFERNKRPDEKIRIGVDFANDLLSGAAIDTQTVTILDDDGVDVSATMLASSSISTTQVLAVVQAGDEGKRYRMFFKAACNDGMIYEHSVEFRVKLDS